jgi:hypothetical protein
MSHFVQIRTQIREREPLVQALRDLHYQFQAGENLVVHGFADNTERAEVVVNTGSKYDIGFRRAADQYEVVADWWGVEGNTRLRQSSFIQDVNRQYAYNVILDQAREQNLLVEEEQTLENGDVVIILSERG